RQERHGLAHGVGRKNGIFHEDSKYRFGISAPATKLSFPSLHIWYTFTRKSGQVLTRQYASVGVYPCSVISQSIRFTVAVSTADSSGRSAYTDTTAPGFSIRIHAIRFRLTT